MKSIFYEFKNKYVAKNRLNAADTISKRLRLRTFYNRFMQKKAKIHVKIARVKTRYSFFNNI